MGDEVVTEDGTPANVSLEVETANGIRHAVETLDESNSGEVSKSQLQAVVANVCRAIKIEYVSEELEKYLPEKEKLTVVEFLVFLESKLLVKGKKLNEKEMDELSWVVVGQKYEDEPHLLTKKDSYKLWLAFKKLDITSELKVDVEELYIVLEKFVRGIGVQWNEQILNEYAEDGAVTFWKFINCLEHKFLVGVDKSVLREGLQDLFDSILDEAMKTGFLNKKGHSMLKSHKSRWFALKPERLTYYVSSGYREKKGEVVINKESTVTSLPDKGSNKYRFLVTCGQTKKEYEQTAPDLRTKQAWITSIQTAIDCFGGQTPLKRDLLERRAKRDADKARKAEEEKKRQEQEDLLSQQRQEIDLLKQRKAEIEKLADEEKAMLDAEIRRREELEELQRNLQQLLEEQKKAREEEAKIRAAKERLLEEERVKREELEALRVQQQQELQEAKMEKEELIERQKEQERVLEEERKRLRHLEEERMKAEEAAKAAHDKLSAAETAAKNAAEQAKNRVRQLKTSIGLKGTVGPKVDPLVTHRGKGAFTLEEFLNRATDWSGLELDEEEKHKQAARQQNSTGPDELVKATSTAAPNQNIPEFLKKAAAWSGLNPETYLENAEEGGKSGKPPKVSAKPAKPPRSSVVVDNEDVKIVNGETQDSEGAQVVEAGDEGQQVVEAGDEGQQVVEGGDEGQQVVEGGDEGQQVVEGGDEGQQVVEGGDEGQQVVKAGDEVQQVVEGGDEGQQVVEGGDEGQQVEEGKGADVTSDEGSAVVKGAAVKEDDGTGGPRREGVRDGESAENEGNDEEFLVAGLVGKNEEVEREEVKDAVRDEEVKEDEVKEDEVKEDEVKEDEVKEDEVKKDEVKKEESEVVESNHEGINADVESGGSLVEEAKDGGSQEGESKDAGGDEAEKNDTSEVEEKAEESHIVNGDSDELQVSEENNEGPVADKGGNQCPDGEDEKQDEGSCDGHKINTPENEECGETKVMENEDIPNGDKTDTAEGISGGETTNEEKPNSDETDTPKGEKCENGELENEEKTNGEVIIGNAKKVITKDNAGPEGTEDVNDNEGTLE